MYSTLFRSCIYQKNPIIAENVVALFLLHFPQSGLKLQYPLDRSYTVDGKGILLDGIILVGIKVGVVPEICGDVVPMLGHLDSPLCTLHITTVADPPPRRYPPSKQYTHQMHCLTLEATRYAISLTDQD